MALLEIPTLDREQVSSLTTSPAEVAVRQVCLCAPANFGEPRPLDERSAVSEENGDTLRASGKRLRRIGVVALPLIASVVSGCSTNSQGGVGPNPDKPEVVRCDEVKPGDRSREIPFNPGSNPSRIVVKRKGSEAEVKATFKRTSYKKKTKGGARKTVRQFWYAQGGKYAIIPDSITLSGVEIRGHGGKRPTVAC